MYDSVEVTLASRAVNTSLKDYWILEVVTEVMTRLADVYDQTAVVIFHLHSGQMWQNNKIKFVET